MNYLIKKFKREEGFGLIEVLVGTAMLLFTATAALTLAHTVTRSETFNEKRMVAYNLAQWAMEDIRKNRDSMWDDIQSDTRWSDKDSEPSKIWLDNLYKDLSNTSGYDCSPGVNGNGYKVFENCVVEEENGTRVEEKYTLKVKISDDIKDLSKLHEQDGARINNNTIADSMAKRVEVIVEWNERGTDVRNLKLTTMLTDWNYLHQAEVK